MKKIIINLPDNGGYNIEGMDEINNHSDCVWAILAARLVEDRAIKQGYLYEIENGMEHRLDKNKGRIQLLVNEDFEKRDIGASVSPTYIQIELPNNVPSKIQPIVILPDENCSSIDVKVSQNGKNYASFELVTTELIEPQIINLNTGSVY
jgi:hypothetical protein|nr:MAG TPA: hypothetical protein [Caudoviricetes sp.]